MAAAIVVVGSIVVVVAVVEMVVVATEAGIEVGPVDSIASVADYPIAVVAVVQSPVVDKVIVVVGIATFISSFLA